MQRKQLDSIANLEDMDDFKDIEKIVDNRFKFNN
jgi:hypothetical protein